MKIIDAPLNGIKLIETDVYHDDRGYFFELFQRERYEKNTIPPFVQDNISRSKLNVLRGLHYQLPTHAQGKLVGVTCGKVWDVAVDIRVNSPTFGEWFAMILSAENHTQIYIPPGFAHGFCVLSDVADFYYKCTDFYSPEHERGIAWDDKDLAISWPVSKPLLSPKDLNYPKLAEISHAELFT